MKWVLQAAEKGGTSEWGCRKDGEMAMEVEL